MNDRILGAAERRDYQIRILRAFIATAKPWCGDEGEISDAMIGHARIWWIGAYEMGLATPFQPLVIPPSWLAVAKNHSKLMSYCRESLSNYLDKPLQRIAA